MSPKDRTEYMKVEMGTEAGQFPEKEYINGIFSAVRCFSLCKCSCTDTIPKPCNRRKGFQLRSSLILAPPPPFLKVLKKYRDCVIPNFSEEGGSGCQRSVTSDKEGSPPALRRPTRVRETEQAFR